MAELKVLMLMASEASQSSDWGKRLTACVTGAMPITQLQHEKRIYAAPGDARLRPTKNLREDIT